ncbi:MAG: triose-phosphate isomerase [Clostridiales bacterium]|nr:triose-phosphate isomerase [Clostridiales bacterium]
MRKHIIAGNWKMNLTPNEAKALVEELAPKVQNSNCEVVVCPPAIDIQAVSEAIKGTNIQLGAQNVHWKENGAFTGEISAKMLLELGVKYAIVGHSERRQYFGETDETVNQRAKYALTSGLIPIICVGESLEIREAGTTNDFVSKQIVAALNGFSGQQVQSLVIAYEPIWAIGTGKTATSQEANDTILAIRNTIAKVFGKETAQNTRIQYGGSMNAKNASELMAMENIDGGLIGGASLKAEDFATICAVASK